MQKALSGIFSKPSYTHNLSLNLSLQRCKDCKVKNRVITLSIQQRPYHEYFLIKRIHKSGFCGGEAESHSCECSTTCWSTSVDPGKPNERVMGWEPWWDTSSSHSPLEKTGILYGQHTKGHMWRTKNIQQI